MVDIGKHDMLSMHTRLPSPKSRRFAATARIRRFAATAHIRRFAATAHIRRSATPGGSAPLPAPAGLLGS